MSDTHKYVGSHPHDLDGRMLAPGETFTPTKEQLAHYSMEDLLNTGSVITLNQPQKGGVATNVPSGN